MPDGYGPEFTVGSPDGNNAREVFPYIHLLMSGTKLDNLQVPFFIFIMTRPGIEPRLDTTFSGALSISLYQLACQAPVKMQEQFLDMNSETWFPQARMSCTKRNKIPCLKASSQSITTCFRFNLECIYSFKQDHNSSFSSHQHWNNNTFKLWAILKTEVWAQQAFEQNKNYMCLFREQSHNWLIHANAKYIHHR